MRIFHIKNIDFDNHVSIDFTIYQVPFTLHFDNEELEGMDDMEITEEICVKLRDLFGYNDVYSLNYKELFTFNDIWRLTRN